jgi:hypothetical protein
MSSGRAPNPKNSLSSPVSLTSVCSSVGSASHSRSAARPSSVIE